MGLELRDVPVQVADDAELPLRLEQRALLVRRRGGAARAAQPRVEQRGQRGEEVQRRALGRGRGRGGGGGRGRGRGRGKGKGRVGVGVIASEEVTLSRHSRAISGPQLCGLP